MTKKELEKIINTALEKTNFEFNNYAYNLEDLLKVLRKIEQQNDVLMFDLIAWSDWELIAIQVFTDVNYKGKNYSIILEFEMNRPYDKEDLLAILWDLYNRAIKLQETFKS